MPAARATATSTASRATASSASAPEVGARRTRFVDGQSATLQGLPVKAGNGPLHILAFRQFDESEAPRLSRGLVANDHGRSCLKACTADEFTEFIVCHFVRKIPHEQLLRHEMLPMARWSRSTTFALLDLHGSI
jgi:hypothetical protein